MTWLQPWAWLGLGALAVPVLVHLFSRRPARTVAFPSLRFLPTSELRPTRRTRISDWPLLLVRLAVLLAAVMALAQPVRRAALAPAAGVVSRVRLVDTLQVAPPAGADSIETLVTALLPEGIPRAVARLRTQPAPRALEIVSTFSPGLIDSAWFAAIPRDVRVVLTPAPPRVDAAAARLDTLRWRTTLTTAEIEAVRRAVVTLGGAPLAVARVTDRASDPRQEIVIPAVTISGGNAVADADAGADARAAAAERLRRLGMDPIWRAAAGSELPLRVQREGDSLLVSVASASPEVALAMLMAASAPLSPRPVATAPPDTATLARWAASPAGDALGAGTAVTDVHGVSTDARWLWLLVLLLLGGEWLMRRATPSAAAERA